jgi:excisionase family DNA binding protein
VGTDRLPDGDRLLTGPEVASLFRVDPRTPSRWAHEGTMPHIKLPGGHYRFRESEVRAILEGEPDGDEG